jgi:hypothetical protein
VYGICRNLRSCRNYPNADHPQLVPRPRSLTATSSQVSVRLTSRLGNGPQISQDVFERQICFPGAIRGTEADLSAMMDTHSSTHLSQMNTPGLVRLAFRLRYWSSYKTSKMTEHLGY